MADAAAKKKRLPALVYRDLKRCQRAVQSGVEDLQKWLKDKAEELGYYADQVNWTTGVVLDEMGKLDIRGNPTIIARLPHDLLKEVSKKNDVVRVLDREYQDRFEACCIKFGLREKQINMQTGDIVDDDAEEVQPVEKPQSSEPVKGSAPN